ncbi:MAG: hypothetical protein NWP69_12215 [Congregibacter sp.]|nr:hypothetical protein [Congregibacter sp.]MDP5071492.1 hypothetical protein [Congregibacter sp.]
MGFILDGTNITLLHGPRKPELRYVLAIAHYLFIRAGTRLINQLDTQLDTQSGNQQVDNPHANKSVSVSCLFDANTGYLLEDGGAEQRSCFEKLTSQEPWASHFRIVPSGTQADEWILDQAKRDGADVISNDRFKDRARAHRWIYKRRHGLYVTNDRLTMPSLGMSLDIHLELPAQPEDYLPILQELLPSA